MSSAGSADRRTSCDRVVGFAKHAQVCYPVSVPNEPLQPFDLVIYHAHCLDGFAAAWVAHQHSPDAEFVSAQYGDVPPDVVDKRVLIVDFSYSRTMLVMMHTCAASLLVLDHHKTAAADLAGLDFAVFDMKRSGAGIAWDVLLGAAHKRPRVGRREEALACPSLVDFVEDRDLWRFRFSDTKAYSAALSVLPFDFDAWTTFAGSAFVEVLTAGHAILAFQQRTVEKFAKRAYVAYFRPIVQGPTERVLAINCPPEFISETADYLKPRADGRAIVGWFFDGVRGDFVFSLRSADDGPDVSEIARKFGGGGHTHAAGFRLPHNPLCVAEDQS